ncbi:MAG: dihydrolipoyl dehydrogenase, partial [Candidatus Brocadiae bacterium]|nr:dihydrolipoyl dehydrogenase [Candidatus Brocadiia bacterium]
MRDKYDFDVAVIGSGPGGYVAGIRAAQLGAKACVIERAELGGVCTNVGCIPTKALWHSARLMLQIGRAGEYGVDVASHELNYPAVAARRDRIVQRLRGGVKALLASNGVELIRAAASFGDPHSLHLEGEGVGRDLTARNVIVAAGSRPLELNEAPFDHEVVMDSADAVSADELPPSILIVGGGYIGIEFACIYSAFGVEVTVVEAMDRILPGMDEDCARQVARTLKKSGVAVLAGTRLEAIRKDDGGVRATLSDGKEVAAHRTLVCVGRRPDLGGLAIEKAGLQPGDGRQLPVNAHMQTAQPHIYAVGDVVGGPMLAHVASREGIVAASHASGTLTAAMDYRVVPACIFAFPEIATVGMSESRAAETVEDVVVKKFPFRALGKAHVMGQTGGFVKMVADARTGELLGVHICSAQASALLGEAALALRLECTADELAETIHAHPTLPEAIREA